MYGVSEAEHASCASPLVLGPVAVAAALLAGFVVPERVAAEPLLPLGLLKVRTVRADTVSGVVFYTTTVGLLFFAPPYPQGVRGIATAAAIGVLDTLAAIALLRRPHTGT